MPDRYLKFRADIQGLRALAISGVVLAHAHVPGLSGGFVGVDVFFVLSGYLITGLLVSEHIDSGSIRYSRFIARRLKRLLPALIVMLLVTTVLAWSLLSTYEARMQTGSLLYAATWTSNFYFALSEFDYFAALRAKDLFLHTWSLGIEEQFYLVWPWLVALSFAASSRIRSGHGSLAALVAAVSTVFLIGLCLCLYWTQTDFVMSFYMMPARGWQFALGAAVFINAMRPSTARAGARKFLESAIARQAAGILGLILIVGSMVFLNDSMTYPGGYALIPSIGAALAIHAGTDRGNGLVARLLGTRGLVWLGDRSYSLYLWHWPVLLLGGAFGIADTSSGLLVLCAIALGAAIFSYRCIELPLWKGRFSYAVPRQVMLLSALALVVTVGMSRWVPGTMISDASASAGRVGTDPRTDPTDAFGSRLTCDSWYFNSDVRPCVSGDGNALHTVVLMGDSIGTQWAPVLPEIYRRPDWRVVLLSKSACAMADIEYFYEPAGGTYKVCTEWRKKSIEFIAALHPEVVFIGSSPSYDFSKSDWIDGTLRTLEQLVPAAQQIVLIPGTPTLSFDGPSCLREPYRFTHRLRDSRGLCEEAQHSSTSDSVAGYLALAAAGLSNVHVLNLNDLVCPQRRCAARTSAGIPVFRDDQHLTASFARSITPEIQTRLESAGLASSHWKQHDRT